MAHFHVLNARLLNCGGNGDVFLGQRSDNGEYVVDKYLREYGSLHARSAFRREVRVLRRNYRGLVRLLAVDTEGVRPHYVMPYLPGGCLTAHAGKLSESQLLAVAMDLALTLADVHAKGDAHGDLKPDNILISHDGRLHVADPLGNGLNCTIVFAQNHGGTPGYWPPEISAGGAISSAGDVYSYGATLYHLSTGQKPSDGEQFDVNTDISPKIRQTILACCHPVATERPNIQGVLRILKGEDWTHIQVARQQVQGFVAATCVIGGFFFLLHALAD